MDLIPLGPGGPPTPSDSPLGKLGADATLFPKLLEAMTGKFSEPPTPGSPAQVELALSCDKTTPAEPASDPRPAPKSKAQSVPAKASTGIAPAAEVSVEDLPKASSIEITPNFADKGEPVFLAALPETAPDMRKAAPEASPPNPQPLLAGPPTVPASQPAPTPPGEDAPEQDHATGLAPGHARRGEMPSPAAEALAHRSARATERVGLPPAPADGPPADDADPALVPQPPMAAPQAEAPVDASGAIAPSSPIPAAGTALPLPGSPSLRPEAQAPIRAPRFASPRFVEEVGIAIARKGLGLARAEDLTIRIEPAELGRIHVRLRFDESGVVQPIVSADHPRVLEQLRLGSQELHRALVDSAARTDVAPPRFESRGDAASTSFASSPASGNASQQQSGQQQGQQSERQRLTYDALTYADEQVAFTPLPTSAGRVDLMA